MAARHLNFTEAAQKLYISQPALSKQIHAIEEELNMILFIKKGKKVYLTPAGIVLNTELQDFEENFNKVVHKAQLANEGNIGELNIGILEGQMVGECFVNAFGSFTKKYPNIPIFLFRDTFAGIRKKLEEGSYNIGISLDIDLNDDDNFKIINIASCKSVMAVSKSNPISSVTITGWEDIKAATFIVIDKMDSYLAGRKFITDCKKRGFIPNIQYAPSLESAMIRVEAGLGIGIVNSLNYLTINPNIKILENVVLDESNTVMAWKKDNINPVIPLFIEEVLNSKR
jgi:DNA-binding transcriptional LysR family regulator